MGLLGYFGSYYLPWRIFMLALTIPVCIILMGESTALAIFASILLLLQLSAFGVALHHRIKTSREKEGLTT